MTRILDIKLDKVVDLIKGLSMGFSHKMRWYKGVWCDVIRVVLAYNNNNRYGGEKTGR